MLPHAREIFLHLLHLALELFVVSVLSVSRVLHVLKQYWRQFCDLVGTQRVVVSQLDHLVG